MGITYIHPEFEVIRNDSRCIACRVCERQCANEVHTYDEKRKQMISDEAKCVNCQRCVSLCPTRALKIVKSDCTFRENANWQGDTIKEIYKLRNTLKSSTHIFLTFCLLIITPLETEGQNFTCYPYDFCNIDILLYADLIL